jgi:hypothetical protein
MFGGAHATIPGLVNSDITITHNHFFKPLSWKSDDPSYAGIPWSVKNLLEFKSAQRVLVEGNILENNWLHAQNGFGILFTPRNDDGMQPQGTVQNVTFRYNIFQHSGSGFNIGGSDSNFPGTTSPSNHVAICDNLVRDINGRAWGGADGRLYQIVNGEPNPVLRPPNNITINHNTAFETGTSGNFVFVGDNANNPVTGFIFENNIQPASAYGFFGSGMGEGIPALRTYFKNPVFTKNVIEAGSSGNYPAGNFFPATWADVRLADYTNCNGGAYSVAACALLATSHYHNAGTDGKDIGANIGAVNATTAGVLP